MENLGAIDNLELLVKLASLGAAGISILAVFLIGIKIFNLPNDTSDVKASLLKFFMGMCLFMAIICGVSSWANVKYTNNKVVEAEKTAKRLGIKYEAQVQKVEVEKQNIEESINNLQNRLSEPPSRENVIKIRSEVDSAKKQVSNLRVIPLDTVYKELKTPERFRRVRTIKK